MTITVDESAVKRIDELRIERNQPALMLRVRVDGGGCSGFQYKLELTEKIADKERLFAEHIITDDISLGFLENATIKFEQKMIGADFVIDNPNAVSGCGCGTSFSI